MEPQDGARAPTAAAAGRANFFIVGAAKCGTTAWYEYLRSHPDIYFPEMKEACFFAQDFPSLRQVHSEAEYERLFEAAGAARVLGDASADHLYSTEAARRIHAYNPDAKIMILLRRQEDFLPSLHNQNLVGFWEDISDFEEAWRISERRPDGLVPATCTEPRQLDYAASGRFAEQVERYLQLFPRGHLLVVQFDDWVADPRATYLHILRFLGLPDDGRASFPRMNEGRSYRSQSVVRFLLHPPSVARRLARPVKSILGLSSSTVGKAMRRLSKLLSRRGYRNRMSPALRQEIRRYYAKDNARLQAMLER